MEKIDEIRVRIEAEKKFKERFEIDIMDTNTYIMDLLRNAKAIKRYEYRTARVDNRIALIRRDTIKDIEDRFVKECARFRDNHVVYELSVYGTTMYAWITDNSVFLGYLLTEEKW